MTSPKLQLIQRRLERQNPERIPAPETGGIGAAIEELIANEVSQRVGEAVKEKSNKHLDMLFKPPAPKYTSFGQIPPTPRTPAPRKPIRGTLQRDGAGLARAMVIDGPDGPIRYIIQRDSTGQAIGFITEEVASEVTYNGQPVPPPNARD